MTSDGPETEQPRPGTPAISQDDATHLDNHPGREGRGSHTPAARPRTVEEWPRAPGLCQPVAVAETHDCGCCGSYGASEDTEPGDGLWPSAAGGARQSQLGPVRLGALGGGRSGNRRLLCTCDEAPGNSQASAERVAFTRQRGGRRKRLAIPTQSSPEGPATAHARVMPPSTISGFLRRAVNPWQTRLHRRLLRLLLSTRRHCA